MQAARRCALRAVAEDAPPAMKMSSGGAGKRVMIVGAPARRSNCISTPLCTKQRFPASLFTVHQWSGDALHPVLAAPAVPVTSLVTSLALGDSRGAPGPFQASLQLRATCFCCTAPLSLQKPPNHHPTGCLMIHVCPARAAQATSASTVQYFSCCPAVAASHKRERRRSRHSRCVPPHPPALRPHAAAARRR